MLRERGCGFCQIDGNRSALQLGYAPVPYFHCREKTCTAYARAIPRAKIESDFAELLRSIEPAPAHFKMVSQGLRKLWGRKEERVAERKKAIRVEIRGTEDEIHQLVSRVIETESEALIAA